VILLDANLLIYAHVESFPQHLRAQAWLDSQLTAGGRVGMPWASLLAFLRIVTNPRIFQRPESMSGAWKQVQDWLGTDGTWTPEPTERHREILDGLLAGGGVRANHVPDAHLAAIAIGHGLVLCSSDADFARYPGLRWEDPLRAA
jgi:toxin-antitoxin system PIN domain toxin